MPRPNSPRSPLARPAPAPSSVSSAWSDPSRMTRRSSGSISSITTRSTRSVVEAIAHHARARFALIDLTIIHRFGQLAPGDPIVFVAAAAAHRRAAFDAVDYLMDRLKTEAPFWKREHGPAGSRWIEPTAEDHVATKRWT